MICIHKSTTGDEFWENEKSNIIDLYVDKGWSLKEIGKAYKCWGSTIGNHLKEWGVKPHKRYNNIYELKEVDYFNNIDDEHKAYWYGFLLADGHINNRGITITLQHQDEYMLELFKADIGSETPITKNVLGYPTFTLTCKQFASYLLNKGLSNRKSYNIDIQLVSSYVPDYLKHHFIRGMFDGNGCIQYYKYDYQKTPMFHLGYTGLKNVCDYIYNVLNLSNKYVSEGNDIFTVTSKNYKKINEINDYLYENATIYLIRKKKTFDDIRLMTFNDYNRDIPNGMKV